MSKPETPRARWSLAAAVTAAISASLCCLGPLVLVALGTGGAWASKLTVLEPLRPVFTTLTAVFFGFGFYRAYRKPAAEACGIDGSCTVPESGRVNRIALGVATPLIIALLAIPYIAPHRFGGAGGSNAFRSANVVQTGSPGRNGDACCVVPGSRSQMRQVALKRQNVDCPACTVTIRKSFTTAAGVQDASVTSEPPQAIVDYDPAKASVEALVKATTDAGHPSSVAEIPSK